MTGSWLVDLLVSAAFGAVGGAAGMVVARQSAFTGTQGDGIRLAALGGVGGYVVAAVLHGLLSSQGRTLGCRAAGTRFVTIRDPRPAGRLGMAWVMTARMVLLPVVFVVLISLAILSGGGDPGGAWDSGIHRQVRA